MSSRTFSTLWDALTSLKLAIICLVLMMVLVVACTLAQVDLGTHAAVNVYMRSWVVWWHPSGSTRGVPVLPGGALVGAVLAVNLLTAQFRRLTLRWTKSGLWLAHAGLILLVAGEFVSAVFQVDAQMTIEQGETLNFVERPREYEVAVIDTTDSRYDEVYAIPQSLLVSGQPVAVTGTPLTLHVRAYHANVELGNRSADSPPSLATAGVGPGVAIRPAPVLTSDEGANTPAAFVEPKVGAKSYGVWLLSPALGAPQTFLHEGHSYMMVLRNRREYLDYTVTLKKFSHDVYPGTDIPKNFSSLVHIDHKSAGEERDTLIFMNQPLRYEGKTFYQASFGKNDTLSVLQVVQNPGWLLPYVACALVTLGLFVHFVIALWRNQRRRRPGQEAT